MNIEIICNIYIITMIDIEIIKNIIKEFAEKYSFIQQIDIETVEENLVFKREDYIKMNNKKFICIDTYRDKLEIAFGKIIIEIDSYDENDWYSIDKDTYIRINIKDIPNEDKLIELIEKQCEKLQQS
jgi:hypothetical protein